VKCTATLLLAGAATALAFMPDPLDGPPHHRTDFSGIQLAVSQNIAAGITNGDGTVWITADSAPADAINGAIAAWNGVATTSARFLPVQSTSSPYNIQDSVNQIVFSDDAFTRALTGGILAATGIYAYLDGTIIDTDIFFSPTYQFSTTQAAGTYDLQSVLTHELGHALGSNHTNILSATMYRATGVQDIHEQTLSADDIAFVSTLYPSSAGNGYGIISGGATVSGAPLLGGVLTAVDPNTGITIGGYTSVTDGTFSMQVPPGNYYVYAEPAVNLGLYLATPQTTVIFTSFESAFAGGNSTPTYLPVQGGATVTANINAAAGVSPLKTPFAAIGAAGAIGDYHGTFTSGSLNISSGQSVDFLFGNPLTAAIAENNIQILGPATLRKGSLRRDTAINLSDGTPVYRFTLDIAPLTANGSASMVFTSGTDIITRSGVLNLTRPQAVNAGSYLGGPVAPGEILSFFGSQVGPAAAQSNGGFDSNGLLPAALGGVTVTFDQTPAPLFYVSSGQLNLQVPYEISGKTSTLMTVSYSGSTIASSTLTVAKSAPGIFVVTNADGSVNGPNAPASVGSVLVIYGTGSGLTSGLVRTGAAAPDNSTAAATVTINGKPVAPIFAGLTSGSVGLNQVNVAIPDGTPSGNTVPLQFSMNGASSQTVNIAVK
jgi:uncharacterized protein (TIGR03437 family)